MSEKNYPYKSKVVLTEKQASKEPIGSFYHPTEKTFRSGACPVGMTLQKGYHRKGYMKMNGTVINNTNVDPVCVKNKGLPGKLLKKEKDDFKEFGYLTSSNNNIRFKSLLEACKVLSYGNVMRKLNILKKKSSKKEDNKSKKLYNIYSSDILILQKWRMKNPDLYKVKNELLLVGGQIFGKKEKVNDDKLREIIKNLKNLVNSGKRFRSLSHYKLSNLDVSEIENTSNLFSGFNFEKAKELGYDVNISEWQLSNVTNMENMFAGSRFDQNLSSWGPYLGNVTNMSKMFLNCIPFNKDLSSWELGKVTNMSYMFCNCRGFDQNLSSWGPYLGNVTTMESMFIKCEKFNQDLSSWGPYLGNVTTMSEMFRECKKFEGLGLKNWGSSLGNVEDIKAMFYGCENFNQDINNWDVSKVTNMSYMFFECKKFNQGLSDWGQRLSNVKYMKAMFAFCYIFDQNINSWDVSNVIYMSYMFFDCYKFNQGLSNWNVSKVENMSFMFHYCKTFNQNLVNWKTKLGKVEDMKCMFSDCYEFKGNGLSEWGPFIDKINNMNDMFFNCYNFEEDLSSWTEFLLKKTHIFSMFYGIKKYNIYNLKYENQLSKTKEYSRYNYSKISYNLKL